MSTTATIAGDVDTEAKRILAMSISKLYASRTQRGGLRLHRSLLLSLVMRTTRDIYHSACMLACPESGGQQSDARSAAEEPMDTSSTSSGDWDELSQQQSPPAETDPETPQRSAEEPSQEDVCDEEMTGDKENVSPAAKSTARHSRKRRGKASVAPDFLPSKRARLEPGEERHAAAPLGIGTTAGFSNCRAGESLTTLSLNLVVPAF